MSRRLGFTLPLALAAFYWFLAERIPDLGFGDPLGPRAFPRLLVLGLVLSSALWFLEARTAAASSDSLDRPASLPAISGGHRHILTACGVIAFLVLYAMLFEPLGYVPTTIVFLICMTFFLDRSRVITNIMVSVLFPVLTYLLFTRLLGVPMPAAHLGLF